MERRDALGSGALLSGVTVAIANGAGFASAGWPTSSE